MDPLKFMFKNNNKFAQSVKQAASQGAKNAANGDGVGGGMLGGIGALVFGTLAVGFLGYESLYTVDGGHRGVVFNRITGVKNRVYGEGTHFIIPFVEKPITYNVRARPRNISSPTGSKDLQTVNITLRVLSEPVKEALPHIYRTLGTDYDERVLPSIGNEVLKGVVAQFNASQLITQRERVSALIRNRLVERARDFNITLTDVSITHLSFGREYTAAVEAKQVAQQEAERAKFIVEKAEQDMRRTIVQAEGEAQSAKMISDAIKQNPNFLQLRRIEAGREIARVISRGSNKVYLGSESLLFNSLIPKDDEK